MVGQELVERQAFPHDAVQGEGTNLHALASAERYRYRLHRERMERPARTVQEGVGDPRASAVDAGAAVGVWRTGLIARIEFAARFAGSGAYGTGSWTDTSPLNGCRKATKVAVWELAENPVACRESLSSRRCAV